MNESQGKQNHDTKGSQIQQKILHVYIQVRIKLVMGSDSVMVWTDFNRIHYRKINDMH